MKLLLDFLNVKEWTAEEILHLFKKHKVCISVKGFEQGYESIIQSDKLQDRLFILEPDKELSFAGDRQVRCGDFDGFGQLFDRLKELQNIWVGEVRHTAKNGPNFDLLNATMRTMKPKFVAGINPWEITISAEKNRPVTIEQILNMDYLQSFLEGKGGLFKKVRACKNPECGNFFVYNRSDKLSCSTACRLRVVNKRRIESGEHAAYQRKMRAVNPASYK